MYLESVVAGDDFSVGDLHVLLGVGVPAVVRALAQAPLKFPAHLCVCCNIMCKLIKTVVGTSSKTRLGFYHELHENCLTGAK